MYGGGQDNHGGLAKAGWKGGGVLVCVGGRAGEVGGGVRFVFSVMLVILHLEAL